MGHFLRTEIDSVTFVSVVRARATGAARRVRSASVTVEELGEPALKVRVQSQEMFVYERGKEKQQHQRKQVTVTNYDTLTAAAASCLEPERVSCHAAGEGGGRGSGRGLGRA